MIRRLVPMLLMGVILVASLVVGQEPPADPPGKGEGPPLRLKRKKRSDVPPPVEPGDKDEKPQPPEKDKAKEPMGKDPGEKDPKEKAKDDEELVPEDGGLPGEPEEDEKDVLERLNRNMRASEEKLGNRELGEPLAQQHRDILRDLDSLIKKSEQQQQGGGGGGGGDQADQQQGEKGEKGGMSGQKGGSSSRRQQARNSRGGSKGGMARSGRREQRGGKQGGKGQGEKQVAGNQQPGGARPQPKSGTGTGGNKPGMGKDDPSRPRPLSGEDTKDVWGHLPESLRAEMNAYSNPQPFHPRYDRIIREYYKTIASQGRKKGD